MSALNSPLKKIDDIGEVEKLNILTVIDNNYVREELETCWGLSFYIEVNGEQKKTILMDCSGSLYDFSKNVSILQLESKFSRLNAIHISHWHHDHAGNLNYVMSMISKSTPIYIPTGNARAVQEIRRMGFNPIELDHPKKIFEGVFSTGSLGGSLSEQSLVFNVRKKGLVIILGCAHPGIIR
ncbi:MAG: hypothetical protein ACTSR3_21265, partial [Candidatus Helarchaeota archaeon]